MATKADIQIEEYGTISMIQALTKRGKEWVKEHIQFESWQVMCGAIASDPRMAHDVAEGACEDGLSVQIV